MGMVDVGVMVNYIIKISSEPTSTGLTCHSKCLSPLRVLYNKERTMPGAKLAEYVNAFGGTIMKRHGWILGRKRKLSPAVEVGVGLLAQQYKYLRNCEFSSKIELLTRDPSSRHYRITLSLVSPEVPEKGFFFPRKL